MYSKLPRENKPNLTWTLGSGGKNMFKRYLMRMDRHIDTHTQTRRHTDKSTYRKNRHRGPILWEEKGDREGKMGDLSVTFSVNYVLSYLTVPSGVSVYLPDS